MDVALGVVLGMVLAASLAAGWRLDPARRACIDPASAAMQRAVHAATTILPHLRRGLHAETSARPRRRTLRTLTGADAVALAGRDALLAFDGPGAGHHRAGDPLERLVPARREERVHVEPRLRLRRAAAARCAPRSSRPLTVRGGTGRHARRALRAAGTAAVGGVPRGGRGGGAGVGDGRAVRARGAGRAARRAPSCGRCARRSRRTSSTTRSPPSPPSSTRGRRRRASC